MSSLSPFILPLGTALLAAGCASYAVPGRAADLSIFTSGGVLDPVRKTDERAVEDLSIADILKREPMAAFPTGLAVARIQADGYRSESIQQTAGNGAYTVVTSRQDGEEQALVPLSALPLVRGIAPVHRLLVPERLETDLELRKIAAQLHADVLLVYTIDTTFESKNTFLPLTAITLGILSPKKFRLQTSAAALLVDTRTGYLYGSCEASVQRPSSGIWRSAEKLEAERLAVEREALEKLVVNLAGTWTGVVATYTAEPAEARPAASSGE
jgi:hypothetical protein